MYLELALIGDTTSLTATGLEYLETSIPGFTARPGNVETIMIEGAGQIAGELLDQAMIVPAEAFAALGTSVFGIPMLDGQQATTAAVVTWAVDTPASTLPADSQVGVSNGDGNIYVFLTDRDLVAPVGGGSQDVVLIARDIGSLLNNSFGACQMIDEVEGVESIIASGSGGGTDPESADEYLDRLSTIISLLAPRPILPEDHGAMASTVPGVSRVSVLNLYYPGTDARDADQAVGDFDLWTPGPAPAEPEEDVARCTTVCIMGLGGTEPSIDLMQDVYELLDANREVNFLNFVMKPTFISVDVKAVVTPYRNRTKAEAIESSTRMVTNWLSSVQFGLMPGTESDNEWNGDNKLRIYEVVDHLNRGQATWYVEDVFVKLSEDDELSWQNTDMDLDGVFAVPVLGEATIT